MMNADRESRTRMDAVQAPIIAVHRRPRSGRRPARFRSGRASCTTARRRAALDAVRAALADAGDARIPGRRRPAGRSSTRSRRSCGGERHRRRARQPHHGDRRRATWRSCTPCWRSPRRATRSSCPCRSISTTRWRFRWPGCRAVRVPTDDALSAASRRASRAAITDRTRAIVTISPNNPSGAVFSEAALRAVNDALPRPRDVPHRRRGLRVLHLRIGAARLAGIASRRRTRTRSRCSRCRRPTASPAGASATWCTRSS